jgi:hypothetical protein
VTTDEARTVDGTQVITQRTALDRLTHLYQLALDPDNVEDVVLNHEHAQLLAWAVGTLENYDVSENPYVSTRCCQALLLDLDRNAVELYPEE